MPALPASAPRLPRRAALGLALSLTAASLVALTPTPAWAGKKSGKSGGKGKKSGGKAFTPPRSSSEETRAERERRLARECRGMPNSGACLGYGR